MLIFTTYEPQLQINLLLQSLATFAMFGVIWLIQLVNYPLQIHVAAENFVDYQIGHMRHITQIVGPLMLLEAISSVWLLVIPLSGIGSVLAWVGFALVLILWISTAVIQVPLHRRLEEGRDERAIRGLIASNWIRTLGWTTRAVTVGWLLLLLA